MHRRRPWTPRRLRRRRLRQVAMVRSRRFCRRRRTGPPGHAASGPAASGRGPPARRQSLTPHPLQVEVVPLQERGQNGADVTHLDRDLVADHRRRLLEHGLLGDEVGVPEPAKSGRVGLVEALATIELVHLPGSVGVAVGAVRAGDRCERGLVASPPPQPASTASPRISGASILVRRRPCLISSRVMTS